MNVYQKYLIPIVLLAGLVLSACSPAKGTALPPVGGTDTSTPVSASTVIVTVVGTVTPQASQTARVQTQVVVVTATPVNTVVPTGTSVATSTPVPAAALTLANSAQVSTTQIVSGTVDATGPTTREETDMLLFGADANGKPRDILVQIGTESMPDPRNPQVQIGGYQFNTANVSWTYTFTLPVGWFGTIHMPGKDKPELFKGDGKTVYTAWRLTVRNPKNYPATDKVNTDPSGCTLLAAENGNGLSQRWTFDVLVGNLHCSNVPTTNVKNNDASNRTTATPSSCPQFGGQNTVPGNDGSPFCKYSGAVMTDKVAPGWKAEYWNGQQVVYANAGDSITTGDATFRPAVQ